MSYPVRYRCPHCEAIVELQRSGYLADGSVTPYPLPGWTYGAVEDDLDGPSIDGVRIVCGEGSLQEGAGCGEAWYLSFERYEDGERVAVRPPDERVELRIGPRGRHDPSP